MKKIFIYADHTSCSEANSGVQRVVRGLGRALQNRHSEVIFVGWDSEYMALRHLSAAEMKHLSRYDGPEVSNQCDEPNPIHLSDVHKSDLLDSWLVIPEVTTLTREGDQVTRDVIRYAKRFGMRVAAIVYDLIPLKLEEYKSGKHEHSNYIQYLFDAHCLIPISQFVGRDLMHFFSNVAAPIISHRPYYKSITLPYQIGQRQRRYFNDPGQSGIILCVGTVEPRKNQITLVRAFINYKNAEPESAVRLIIVGNVHPIMADKLTSLVSGRTDIEILNFVQDDQLELLYQNAIFTVFPSIEEGFGLPIAESFWFGVPCVCANFGSMAEIFPNEVDLKVDVRDENALSAKIAALANDMSARERFRSIIASSQLKNWDDYAEEFEACLNNAPGVSRVYCYIDSTVSYHGNTGVQRVARRLSAALERSGVNVDYLKWNREDADFTCLSSDDLAHVSKWNGPTGSTQLGYSPNECSGHWLVVPELVLPDPNGAMIINAARAKGMKIAFVFFDLIPVTLTDLYNDITQRGYHMYYEMISKADLLIPLSKSGEDELWRYYSERFPRLNTIRNRIQHITLPGEFGTHPRYTCAERKVESALDFRFLAVGTIEPRKNHLAVIHGFRRAQGILKQINSNIRLHLTFAGSTRDYSAYAAGVVHELERTENATLVDGPTDIELGELYSAHDATIFVSLLEGFGIPVLESLWHGKPCIASNNGALGDVASDGGCLRVPPRDGDALGDAIFRMATDIQLYNRLVNEAVERVIPTWVNYSQELTWKLNSLNSKIKKPAVDLLPVYMNERYVQNHRGPLLSIVVSTYNRASWLRQSLPLIVNSASRCATDVELLVVDNESTDDTGDVAAQFLDRHFFRYHRNDKNVGMLGNLSVCARMARGAFVWVIGDDDLVRDGVVPRLIDVIRQYPRSEIIYLNYSYTRFDRPEELDNIDDVVDNSTLISPITPSHFSEAIKTFSGENENLYTAIYACIFRRDHAVAAYTQDTSGSPFSSMLTCIPTSDYVLRNMADRPGYWIGDSYLVVNMNVSWLRWALIWHMERMPDLFDLAESVGVSPLKLEKYRRNHCADPATWAHHIYFGNDPMLQPMFSMERFYERCKGLPEFTKNLGALQALYTKAYLHGRVRPHEMTPKKLAEHFGLLPEILDYNVK